MGLAYIALDRFRYTDRVKKLLAVALREVNAGIAKSDAADEDTSQIRIQRRLKDVSENGLGMKLFIKRGPRTFGVGNKSGWDIHITCFFLFMNFISLCLGCLFVQESYQWLFRIIYIIAILGIVYPVGFILRGKRHINTTMAFINDEIKDAGRLYSLSVSELLSKIRNLPYS